MQISLIICSYSDQLRLPLSQGPLHTTRNNNPTWVVDPSPIFTMFHKGARCTPPTWATLGCPIPGPLALTPSRDWWDPKQWTAPLGSRECPTCPHLHLGTPLGIHSLDLHTRDTIQVTQDTTHLTHRGIPTSPGQCTPRGTRHHPQVDIVAMMYHSNPKLKIHLSQRYDIDNLNICWRQFLENQ